MATKTYKSVKRKKFIFNEAERAATGKGTQTQSYLNAGYKAANNKVARVNASALAKHPQVKEELNRFKDLVLSYASPNQVAQRLGKNITSGDGRLSDSAMDKWLKIFDIYPATKSKVVGLFDKLSELERQEK